ncbi:MAG: prolyl oligopeptidase family serine peptidase [Pseudomonadota bacterium]
MIRVTCLAMMLVAVVLASGPSKAEEPLPADAFGELPRIADAAISPDGRQVALLVNVSGTHVISVLDLERTQQKPRMAALPGNIKPMWIRWANDEQVMAAIWRNERINGTPITSSFIYTFNASTMKGDILIEPRDMIRQDNSDVIDWLDDDPDYILMAFSKRDQSQPDVQRVNVVSGRSKRLKKGRSNIQSWYTDRRGEPRVGQGISDRATAEPRWNLTIRDADSETWRSHKDYAGLSADENIFGFTADPNELIVGRYNGKKTLGLYIYDLSEQAITRTLYHDERYDAEGLVYSRGSDEIAGVEVAAEEPETRLFEGYGSAVEQAEAKLPNYTVDFVDQSADGTRTILKISSPWDPGVMALWKTEDQNFVRLAANRPSLPVNRMGSVSAFKYTARDGVPIPAYATLPSTVGSASELQNLPFIVLPHGGPYARDYNRFDYLAQFFAARGFGVLQMNFRGSAGFGEEFEEAGRKNWKLMHQDIEDGARWLLEKGYADPDRLCIAGWSFGGYAALMGAILHPDLYGCAISIAGVTDLEDLVRDSRRYRFGRFGAQRYIRDGFADNAEMRQYSPVRRVDDLKVPVFLAHGTQDVRVHVDQYRRLRSRLGKDRPGNRYLQVKDDHFFSAQENRQALFNELDAFLADFLAGVPATAASARTEP